MRKEIRKILKTIKECMIIYGENVMLSGNLQ